MKSRPPMLEYPCIIIKLGGSLITKKAGGIAVDILQSLASEVESIIEQGHAVLVVCGGGWFTKAVAFEYNLNTDFLSIEQKHVVEEYRKARTILNGLVLQVFERANIRCAQVETSQILESEDGEIKSRDVTKVSALLNDRILTIMSGDVLVDKARDYFACSGDQITSHMATILKPRAVLFLTNVDGIYENFPPDTKDEKPLAVADSAILARIRKDYRVGQGDMCGKLEQALICARSAGSCYILNGKVRGNLTQALKDEVQVGTKII